MNEESSYIKEIKELILARNTFDISAVRELKFIKGLNFNKKEYPSVIKLIIEDNLENIMDLPNSNKTFEDLTILEFYDQNNDKFIVTVYDTDGLWQDPKILDIFKR